MRTVSVNDLIAALQRARKQIYDSHALPSDARAATAWLDEIIIAVGEEPDENKS